MSIYKKPLFWKYYTNIKNSIDKEQVLKQLDLFSVALEDQIINLKQGEEMEFYRGKERLLISKHEKYNSVCFYQGLDFSEYALHVDEKVPAEDYISL